MSVWLFDLGNSRLKCAEWTRDELGAVVSVEHTGGAFPPDWEARLPTGFSVAVVASVATPALTASLLDALTRRCPRMAMARPQVACAGVRIAYAQPRRLGVDRFLALLAAHAHAPRPALVVGVGTALTIDLLDAQGVHRGGRIAPSPTLMREALHARAPHLPATGGDYAEFADDTAAALASGCDGAALALIEHSREAAIRLLGTTPMLLLHGGGAAHLPQLRDAVHAPALVLEGLAQWARASAVAA